MRFLRPIAAGLMAVTSVAVAPIAHAQIAPGIIEPATKVDGLLQSHIFACVLASSGRPVPGVNMVAPDLMGDGLSTADVAPDWFTKALTFDSAANFAKLETGDGDVWIAFEEDSRRCTIAAQTSHLTTMRSAFEEKAYTRGDWKKKKDRSAIGYLHQMKVGRIKFLSKYRNLGSDSQIFAVQVTTD